MCSSSQSSIVCFLGATAVPLRSHGTEASATQEGEQLARESCSSADFGGLGGSGRHVTVDELVDAICAFMARDDCIGSWGEARSNRM